MAKFDKSRQAVAAGSAYLAHGVGSDFRLGISPTPLVFEGADGPYLFDVDGNRLIDYYLGMGPMILGHTPAPVIAAVTDQLHRGILFAGQNDLEYEAARLVCEMVPCAELVRFASSGSEAVQAALRVARSATGREVVVKFEGHYHGWFDNILWSTAPSANRLGPRDQPTPVPGSAGQEISAGQHVEVLPWNDQAAILERLSRGDVAAVIMEPVMCNTSAVLPLPGYLEAVREACTSTATVLIFDEVITGFRVGPGGAQERLGVTPDLATFGKAIANGFPVAAFAGRRDLMEMVGGGGRVVHAGTYNGQAVTMAAAVATLNRLREPGTYESLEARGNRLRDGITSRLDAHGVTATSGGYGTVFHIALGVSEPITDYRTALAADKAEYLKLCVALLEGGVRVLERGAWFMSTAHDDAVIDRTLEILDGALNSAR